MKKLEKAIERKRERRGKEIAIDSEDIAMEDRSNDANTGWQPYKDLSGYEDENEAQVRVTPVTKK